MEISLFITTCKRMPTHKLLEIECPIFYNHSFSEHLQRLVTGSVLQKRKDHISVLPLGT